MRACPRIDSRADSNRVRLLCAYLAPPARCSRAVVGARGGGVCLGRPRPRSGAPVGETDAAARPRRRDPHPRRPRRGRDHGDRPAARCRRSPLELGRSVLVRLAAQTASTSTRASSRAYLARLARPSRRRSRSCGRRSRRRGSRSTSRSCSTASPWSCPRSRCRSCCGSRSRHEDLPEPPLHRDTNRSPSVIHATGSRSRDGRRRARA